MKKTKLIGIALLLGATFLTPTGRIYAAEAGETWQQGGLSTNSVSDSTAKQQKAISDALAYWGILANGYATISAFIPLSELLPVCNCANGTATACNVICSVFPFTGTTAWGFNTDVLGAALDGMLLYDAMNKEAKWSEDIPELQAAVRQIGEKEDFWDECAEDEKEDNFCNSVNAVLDGTEVHISTLQNVGLEAVADAAGKVLKTPEELLTAAPYIQEAFGTEHLSTSATSGSDSSGSSGSSGSVIYWRNYMDGTGSTTRNSNSSGTNNTNTSTTSVLASAAAKEPVTEEERKSWAQHKLAHLQYMGTAGVARADLGITLAVSEQDNSDRLTSYVGSGKGLIAQIEVLCGLDLTLAQRLNALNMLYGQQAANEAASALQLVEER